MSTNTKSKPKSKSKRPAAKKPASPPAAKMNESAPTTQTVAMTKLTVAKLTKLTNKAEIIREALAKGVMSPSEISEYARTYHKLDLDPKYVSVIKSQIGARERSRKTSFRGDAQKAAMEFALKCGSANAAIKRLNLLREDHVASFAVAMGGVDRAVRALDELNASLAGE